MEEEVMASPSNTADGSVSASGGGGSGGGSEKIDERLEEALTRFQRYDEQDAAAILYLSDVRFNCATVNRLTEFLVCSDSGGGGVKKKNIRHDGPRHPRQHEQEQPPPKPVQKLSLATCTFHDEESLALLRDFFDSNKSPQTLEKVEIVGLIGGHDAAHHVFKSLLSCFHKNKTVKELVLLDNEGSAVFGMVVGNLLLQNTALTTLEFNNCIVNTEFIRAMRSGLLASRGRLQSLRLICVDMGNGFEALNELRLVYENNDGGQENNTVLSELDVSQSGPVGGNHLHRLLLTLPCLKKLNVSNNPLGLAGVHTLFRTDSSVMRRLQSLSMARCGIGNVGLAQMAVSIPDSAPLVELDLSDNGIEGPVGCFRLARLLRCCGNLETLILSRNHGLGPDGARVLAPALANLGSLQKLEMSVCNIQDAAMEILASLNNIPYLKSLNLTDNNLPPIILVSLSGYLNGPGGRCLEDLNLFENRELFGAANNNQQEPFYYALANHTAIQCLDVRLWGMMINLQQPQQVPPLQSAVLKNRSLVTVNGARAEYMRRDELMALIQSTMSSGSTNIRFSVWPMALGICAPRFNQVGARPIFCLVQKMAEGDVFVHTAAIYRFEKVRASIRVERWWRGRHL